MSEHEFYPRARTRRVEGGITARSTRGAIGESWWSKRFLAVLESFALGSRLTRGRNYARAGQVVSLAVAPGDITAVVQGSRPRPYEVHIGLSTFSNTVWSRVEGALAGQALYSARLLAGELPTEIEAVFVDADVSLFPAKLADLRMRCSCPDSAVPCKHLAATCYLLAEAFDDDPFQILYWRGRDRETLLRELRRLRTGASDTAPDGDVPARVTGAAVALAGLPAADDTLERFWLSPVPLGESAPTLATEPDLLLRQLPTPGPQLGGPALLAALRRLYRRG